MNQRQHDGIRVEHTYGLATPVDVSHQIIASDMARGTACRLKDESVRSHSKAGSLFCAVAIALKSMTDRASGLDETFPMAAHDKASATGSNIGSILRDDIQMTCLSWSVPVRASSQGKCKGLWSINT